MVQLYTFKLKLSPKKGEVVFFPIPQDSKYQKIYNLKTDLNIQKVRDNKYIAVVQNSEIEFKAELFGKKDKESKAKFKKSLSKDRFINGQDLEIKKIAESIKGDPIKGSYDFVLNYLEYGKPIEGLHPYSQALKEKITDCGGFSTLLASILNAKGIETRLVVGFLINKNLKHTLLSKFKPMDFDMISMHAWLEAQTQNGWFVMDPSIEWRRRKGFTKREGGFGFVPNDRLVVSFGEDFVLKFENKQYKLDILQNPESFKL